MGQGRSTSKYKFAPTDKVGQTEDVREVFKVLSLNDSDIDKIYDIFRSVDSEDMGFIRSDEFLALTCDVDPTPFALAIFQLFDTNTLINFMEFVCAVHYFALLMYLCMTISHLYFLTAVEFSDD
jgi:Ca2+-binding EF-hand superfamily protein